MANRPKIAIIGNGNVGSALKQGATRAGYEAKAVGNEPAKVRELALWGDIIVLAVPFGERFNALREMGKVDGKVLVDVSNAVGANGYEGSVEQSGAEELQDKAPALKVVKAFNTVFAVNMAKGEVKGEHLSLLAAGDDLPAKKQVMEFGAALGFEPVDAGPLNNARWLEALGFLNIQLGYTQKLGTDIGFRLVGAPAARRTATAATQAR